VQKDGSVVWEEFQRQSKSTKGMEYDPYELMSSKEGTPIERVYAEYATKMKAMGDKARLESTRTGSIPYDANAAKIFKEEVKNLEDKLTKAEKNAPLERRAWLIANTTVELRKENNPILKEDNDALKKVRDQAIKDARDQVGAGKERIVPTDREWEAIQSGAIHKTKLEAILKEMDDSVAKKLAMPKEKKTYSDNTVAKAKLMLSKGATVSEIAERLGISVEAVHQIV
jgi:hypothetical protein